MPKWTATYLERKYGMRGRDEFVNAKRRELEASTGVKWSSYAAHGDIILVPVLDVKRITQEDDPEKGERLAAVLTPDGAGWESLAQATGMTLPEVMAVGLALTRAQRAIPDVNRSGGWAALRRGKGAPAEQKLAKSGGWQPNPPIETLYEPSRIPPLSLSAVRDASELHWHRLGDIPQAEESVQAKAGPFEWTVKHSGYASGKPGVYTPKLYYSAYMAGWSLTSADSFTSQQAARDWCEEVYEHMPLEGYYSSEQKLAKVVHPHAGIARRLDRHFRDEGSQAQMHENLQRIGEDATRFSSERPEMHDEYIRELIEDKFGTSYDELPDVVTVWRGDHLWSSQLPRRGAINVSALRSGAEDHSTGGVLREFTIPKKDILAGTEGYIAISGDEAEIIVPVRSLTLVNEFWTPEAKKTRWLESQKPGDILHHKRLGEVVVQENNGVRTYRGEGFTSYSVNPEDLEEYEPEKKLAQSWLGKATEARPASDTESKAALDVVSRGETPPRGLRKDQAFEDKLNDVPTAEEHRQWFDGSYGPEIDLNDLGFRTPGMAFGQTGVNPRKWVVRRLKPGQLYRAQSSVTRELVRAKAEPGYKSPLPHNDGLPEAVLYQGKYYLQDHHRAAAQAIRDGYVDVKVTEYVEHPKKESWNNYRGKYVRPADEQKAAQAWLRKDVEDDEPAELTPAEEHAAFDRAGQHPDDFEGKAPNHNWDETDMYGPDAWDEDSVRTFAGARPSDDVYRAMVDLSELNPEIAYTGFGDEEGSEDDSYDWSHLQQSHRRGGPPPIVVERTSQGNLGILDGNHRTHYWQEQGYDVAPAWVVDSHNNPLYKAAYPHARAEIAATWTDPARREMALDALNGDDAPIELRENGELLGVAVLIPGRRPGTATVPEGNYTQLFRFATRQPGNARRLMDIVQARAGGSGLWAWSPRYADLFEHIGFVRTPDNSTVLYMPPIDKVAEGWLRKGPTPVRLHGVGTSTPVDIKEMFGPTSVTAIIDTAYGKLHVGDSSAWDERVGANNDESLLAHRQLARAAMKLGEFYPPAAIRLYFGSWTNRDNEFRKEPEIEFSYTAESKMGVPKKSQVLRALELLQNVDLPEGVLVTIRYFDVKRLPIPDAIEAVRNYDEAGPDWRYRAAAVAWMRKREPPEGLTFRQIHGNPGQTIFEAFLVEEFSHVPVGNIIIRRSERDRRNWVVDDVEVRDKFRRRGIATALYRKASEWAKVGGGRLYTSGDYLVLGESLTDSLRASGDIDETGAVKAAAAGWVRKAKTPVYWYGDKSAHRNPGDLFEGFPAREVGWKRRPGIADLSTGALHIGGFTDEDDTGHHYQLGMAAQTNGFQDQYNGFQISFRNTDSGKVISIYGRHGRPPSGAEGGTRLPDKASAIKIVRILQRAGVARGSQIEAYPVLDQLVPIEEAVAAITNGTFADDASKAAPATLRKVTVIPLRMTQPTDGIAGLDRYDLEEIQDQLEAWLHYRVKITKSGVILKGGDDGPAIGRIEMRRGRAVAVLGERWLAPTPEVPERTVEPEKPANEAEDDSIYMAARGWLRKAKLEGGFSEDAGAALDAYQATGYDSEILDPVTDKQTLPLASLLPTQDAVKDEVVAIYVEDPKAKPGKPHILRHNGKYWINDGHHRIEAAKKRGESEMEVWVSDLDALLGKADRAVGPRRPKPMPDVQTVHDVLETALRQKDMLNARAALDKIYANTGVPGAKEQGLYPMGLIDRAIHEGRWEEALWEFNRWQHPGRNLEQAARGWLRKDNAKVAGAWLSQALRKCMAEKVSLESLADLYHPAEIKVQAIRLYLAGDNTWAETALEEVTSISRDDKAPGNARQVAHQILGTPNGKLAEAKAAGAWLAKDEPHQDYEEARAEDAQKPGHKPEDFPEFDEWIKQAENPDENYGRSNKALRPAAQRMLDDYGNWHLEPKFREKGWGYNEYFGFKILPKPAPGVESVKDDPDFPWPAGTTTHVDRAMESDTSYTDELPEEFQALGKQGYVFRGMQNEELQAALRNGYFKSNGSYNFDHQKGWTIGTHYAPTAGIYASSFAPVQHRATFGRPGYVVAFKPHAAWEPENPHNTEEVHRSENIPVEEIHRIFEVRPYKISEGEVSIGRDTSGGTRQAPSTYLKFKDVTDQFKLDRAAAALLRKSVHPEALASEYIRIHNAAAKEYNAAFRRAGARMWHDDDAHPIPTSSAGFISEQIARSGTGAYSHFPYPLTVLDGYPDVTASARHKLDTEVQDIHDLYQAEWTALVAGEAVAKVSPARAARFEAWLAGHEWLFTSTAWYKMDVVQSSGLIPDVTRGGTGVYFTYSPDPGRGYTPLRVNARRLCSAHGIVGLGGPLDVDNEGALLTRGVVEPALVERLGAGGWEKLGGAVEKMGARGDLPDGLRFEMSFESSGEDKMPRYHIDAMIGRKTIGSIWVLPDEDQEEFPGVYVVENVYTADKFQRRGIATALYLEAGKLIRGQGGKLYSSPSESGGLTDEGERLSPHLVGSGIKDEKTGEIKRAEADMHKAQELVPLGWQRQRDASWVRHYSDEVYGIVSQDREGPAESDRWRGRVYVGGGKRESNNNLAGEAAAKEWCDGVAAPHVEEGKMDDKMAKAGRRRMKQEKPPKISGSFLDNRMMPQEGQKVFVLRRKPDSLDREPVEATVERLNNIDNKGLANTYVDVKCSDSGETIHSAINLIYPEKPEYVEVEDVYGKTRVWKVVGMAKAAAWLRKNEDLLRLDVDDFLPTADWEDVLNMSALVPGGAVRLIKAEGGLDAALVREDGSIRSEHLLAFRKRYDPARVEALFQKP